MDGVERRAANGLGSGGRPGLAAPTGVVALIALALVAALGCSGVNFPKPDFTKILPADAPEPTHVELGTWHKDHLDCAQKRCDNFYTIDVMESGELKVEAYAPSGAGLPDFGVVLLDPMGLKMATSGEPGERPKRLVSKVAPGRYVVKVHAMGPEDTLIGYELIARWNEPERRVTRKPTPPKPSPPPPTTAPSPAPTERDSASEADVAKAPEPDPAAPSGLQSQVLDVENEGEMPRYVLLEVGAPDGLEPGMKGRLWNAGRPIGRFEIIEVYREGSRAQIDGAIDGEINIDTIAEVLN